MAPLSRRLPDVVIPPGGFHQIDQILVSNGLSLANGYVRIERVSGTGPYYAYAVINDESNSDGSEKATASYLTPQTRVDTRVSNELADR